MPHSNNTSFTLLLNVADFVAVIKLKSNILTIKFHTRIFSVLFRKRKGDIHRMPPLRLRKITRKSTAVGVVSAFVFYLLIIESSPYGVFCSLCFFFHKKHYYKRKRKQTLNRPSHVSGGGYAHASPPAIKCYALAPRASPVEMAWGYAVKRIICLVHYGKGKNYTRNQSYTHIPPLNTRKEF